MDSSGKTSACLVLHLWHTSCVHLREERANRFKLLPRSIQRFSVGSVLKEWANVLHELKRSRHASEHRKTKHDRLWLIAVWGEWRTTHHQHRKIVLKLRYAFGMLSQADRSIRALHEWGDSVKTLKQQRFVMAKYRLKSNKWTCHRVVHAWSAACARFSAQYLFSARMERQIALRNKQCVYLTWLAVTLDSNKLITSARRVVERSAFNKLRRGFHALRFGLTLRARADNVILARVHVAQVLFLLLQPTTSAARISSTSQCHEIDLSFYAQVVRCRSVFLEWSHHSAQQQERCHLGGKITRNMCLLIKLKHTCFYLWQLRTDRVRSLAQKMKAEHPLHLLSWCTRSWEHTARNMRAWRTLCSHAIAKPLSITRQSTLSRVMSHWRLVSWHVNAPGSNLISVPRYALLLELSIKSIDCDGCPGVHTPSEQKKGET